MSTDLSVHRARGGGRWYPADGGVLTRMVDDFLERAENPSLPPGRILGAIAPHAGFEYSGRVAGHTYRALRDATRHAKPPETVVVLGFCHRDVFPGIALLGGTGVETPIGVAPLDAEATAWLAASTPVFTRDNAPHAGEHSAENQIPFLQRALPGVALVVGLFGEHEDDTVAAAADALAALARGRRIVVVASTDLLHDPDYYLVTRTDRETVRDIAALDAPALAQRWRPEFQVCCGIGPVQTLIRYLRASGGAPGTVLCACNSGDDHPESRGEWVVGYGAVVFGAKEVENIEH